MRLTLRPVAFLLLGVGLAVCSDPSGPNGRTAAARFNFAPRWSAQASRSASALADAGLTTSTVRVIITRLPSQVLKDTTVNFANGDASLTLDLSVDASAGETLDAELQYLSGQTIVYDGHATVTAFVVVPADLPPQQIPITYVGPGASAATVTLSPSSGSFPITSNVTFTATVKDSSSNPLSGTPLSWSLSDSTLGSINSAGVFTPVKVGTETVTATTPTSVAGAATITLIPGTTVTIAPRGGTIVSIGDVLPLSATVRDSTGSVVTGPTLTWTSRSAAVATVGTTGIVTSVANGTARIVAVSGTGMDSVTVTVAQVVDTVTTSKDTVKLSNVGDAATVVATPLDKKKVIVAGTTATFTSNDPTVATVTSGGVITLVGSGSTFVTAAAGGKTTKIVVSGRTVTISPRTGSFTAIGDAVPLSATVLDAAGKPIAGATVTWVSRSPAVATVNSSGSVVSAGNGTARIVATSGAGADSITVTVAQVLDSILVAPDTLTFASTGSSVTIHGTPVDKNGAPAPAFALSYVSADPTVATVTSAGLVTFVGTGAGGSTTITVSAGTKTTKVFVTKSTGTVGVGFSFGSTLGITGGPAMPAVGDTVTLVASVSGGGTPPTTVTPSWSSSNPARATVSPSGFVVFADTGTVTIYASYLGLGASSAYTVRPGPVLRSFSFSPRVLNGVSTSFVISSFAMGLTDEGASGVTGVEVDFTGPGGATAKCLTAAPIFGTANNGTWSCAATFAQGSATGTWHVSQLVITGSVTRTYKESVLALLGPTTFTINP